MLRVIAFLVLVPMLGKMHSLIPPHTHDDPPDLGRMLKKRKKKYVHILEDFDF